MNKNKVLSMLSCCLILYSCGKIFSEDCLYTGYVHAYNEFRHTSDMQIPKHTDMYFMAFPQSGDEKYGVTPFTENGDIVKELPIGSYDFLAFNKGQNLLRGASDINTIQLYTPVENGMIRIDQEYIYASTSAGRIATDDTLMLNLGSTVMVQKIVFNVTVTNVPAIIQFTDISAELDGVTTSRFIKSKVKGKEYATLPFTIPSGNKPNFFSEEILVFGINNTPPNIIRMILNGNTQYETEIDLKKVLDNFQADGISIDITIRLEPELGIATASIEGWKDLDWGDIDIGLGNG